MDELSQALDQLKSELKALVPKALRSLAESGTLTSADPLDAVGISYSQVGCGRVFHWVSARTAQRRSALETGSDDDEDVWNTSEYDITGDLSTFVEAPTSYTRVCDRLTELTVGALDARDEDDEDYSEFDRLAGAVREVCHWLTENWCDEIVPAAGHTFFFAVDWYHDALGDSVARSVTPANLRRAGHEPPEVECRECEHRFKAPVHTIGEPFDCPGCGDQA